VLRIYESKRPLYLKYHVKLVQCSFFFSCASPILHEHCHLYHVKFVESNDRLFQNEVATCVTSRILFVRPLISGSRCLMRCKSVFGLRTKWNVMSWFHFGRMGWFHSCVQFEPEWNGLVPFLCSIGEWNVTYYGNKRCEHA
jgi:hypothetical protein